MIAREELEPAGWTSHPTDSDDDLFCVGYFTRLDERYRLTLKLTQNILDVPSQPRWELSFSLCFNDHWLHCDINVVPEEWSLPDVEEYVRRAYLLLNARPIPRNS